MQAHAGYRLHFMVVKYALRTARQRALYADGLRHKALKALHSVKLLMVTGSNEQPARQCAPGPWLSY